MRIKIVFILIFFSLSLFCCKKYADPYGDIYRLLDGDKITENFKEVLISDGSARYKYVGLSEIDDFRFVINDSRISWTNISEEIKNSNRVNVGNIEITTDKGSEKFPILRFDGGEYIYCIMIEGMDGGGASVIYLDLQKTKGWPKIAEKN